MFEKLFEAADLNKDGVLDKEEAHNFFTLVSTHRPDHEALDETKFEELFAAAAVDGHLPKAVARHAVLSRAQNLGFVEK